MLIFIIGGFQNGTITSKTWIIDPSNGFKIRKGPYLNQRRSSFSCGKMEICGKIFIVVAGGYDGSTRLDSVEILEPFSGQSWKLGMVH